MPAVLRLDAGHFATQKSALVSADWGAGSVALMRRRAKRRLWVICRHWWYPSGTGLSWGSRRRTWRGRPRGGSCWLLIQRNALSRRPSHPCARCARSRCAVDLRRAMTRGGVWRNSMSASFLGEGWSVADGSRPARGVGASRWALHDWSGCRGCDPPAGRGCGGNGWQRGHRGRCPVPAHHQDGRGLDSIVRTGPNKHGDADWSWPEHDKPDWFVSPHWTSLHSEIRQRESMLKPKRTPGWRSPTKSLAANTGGLSGRRAPLWPESTVRNRFYIQRSCGRGGARRSRFDPNRYIDGLNTQNASQIRTGRELSQIPAQLWADMLWECTSQEARCDAHSL